MENSFRILGLPSEGSVDLFFGSDFEIGDLGLPHIRFLSAEFAKFF